MRVAAIVRRHPFDRQPAEPESVASTAVTAPAGAPFPAFLAAIDAWPILPFLATALVLGLIAIVLGLRTTRRDAPDPESAEREITDALQRRTLRAGRPLRDDAQTDTDDSSGGASTQPS